MKFLIKFFLLFCVGVIAVGLWLSRDTGPVYPEGASESERAKILRLHQIKRAGGNDVVDAREEWDGQRLIVTHRVGTYHGGKSWVFGVFSSTQSIMEKLEEIAPGRYKQVNIDARLPTRSRLGEQGDTRGMLVYYNWGDIKAAHWENLTSFDVADLSEKLSLYGIAREPAQEYCLDGNTSRFSPRFCAEAMQ